jgi:hypothetical protein
LLHNISVSRQRSPGEQKASGAVEKKPVAEQRREPAWLALCALLSVGALHWALPEELSPGPSWLVLALVAVIAVPAVISRRQGRHKLNQLLGYVVLVVVTISLIWSLALLIRALPDHKQSSRELLQSAAALWISNIFVFASWYWRLDAGGPMRRETRGAHTEGAFLFPQMTLDDRAPRSAPGQLWIPGFLDYLFLAFNTSTAFSPTDVPVLSRWAKVMMMVQAIVSLTTVVFLAARAVNML